MIMTTTRVIARLFKIVEACGRCCGLKRKIRLAVLTAGYLTSNKEPNSSARRGKQARLALICPYDIRILQLQV